MARPARLAVVLARAWIEDAGRGQEVKLPEGLTYRTRAQLALELIGQMRSWEVPRLPVVANSAYGNRFDFREQLRQRQIDYVMAVEPKTLVGTEDPNALLVPPSTPTGRSRRYPPLTSTPTPKTSRPWRSGCRLPLGKG